MDQGLLPNLAGIRARGAFLPCASVTPPATFPAWTTCVTGLNPGRHGILDFTEVVQGQQAIRFVNRTWRGAPALWNLLSDAGKRVCVLGVPGTYPPEPVNGILVSGFDSPVATGVDASFVYPRDRYADVRDWRFQDVQETDIGPGWHDRAMAGLLKKCDDQERIALRLLEEEPWDFFMAVFGMTDTVAHHFWLFHDPQSPRYQPSPHASAVRDIYTRLDATVGRLMDAAGDDVVVGIVSDHGFGGAGDGVVHLNNWLAQEGLLQFTASPGNTWLKRAALTCTPESWRGTLFRRFQGLATRAESQSRFAGIDWENTRAWSEELNYFPSVRVNLAGRDPFGTVKPADYTLFVRDLCDRLENWERIAHAWPRGEVYDGPYVERAPDIILELALEDGYSHSCLRSRGGAPFRRIAPGEYLGGKERGMTGNHRPTGICMLSEPVAATATRLEDITPTVLDVLGLTAPAMDGTSLLGGVSNTSLAAMAAMAAVAPGTAEPYTEEEQEAMEARLRDLGYYE
jgi:predicted AlkP superfamily phosphohydrolase/phosphomutase